MASKAFANALKKKKSRFNKAKKAKPGQYDLPDIDDGTYVAKIGATTALRGEDNIPVVEFRWIITRGEFKGKGHRHQIWLINDDDEREQRNWDDLSRRLQVLDYDMDDIDITDIPDIIEEIDKTKPLVRVGVKNWESESGSKGINCFFNELLEDDDEEDESEEEEEEEDSADEEEAEEDEEEEDDDVDSDESEEDEEEYENVEKGDEVKYKRKKYKVTSSNQGKETCTLKHSTNGQLLKNVPWDDVILVD